MMWHQQCFQVTERAVICLSIKNITLKVLENSEKPGKRNQTLRIVKRSHENWNWFCSIASGRTTKGFRILVMLSQGFVLGIHGHLYKSIILWSSCVNMILFCQAGVCSVGLGCGHSQCSLKFIGVNLRHVNPLMMPTF